MANSWTALDGVAGVYYKTYTKDSASKDLVVFNNFQIADNANEKTGWANANNATVKVTAYAIQKDGFASAADAWTASGFAG